MNKKSDKYNRIFLWLFITGGLLSLLFYGLSSVFIKPTIETITTHAPTMTSGNQSAIREVNYQGRKRE